MSLKVELHAFEAVFLSGLYHFKEGPGKPDHLGKTFFIRSGWLLTYAYEKHTEIN